MLILYQVFLADALNNTLFFKDTIIEGLASGDDKLKIQVQKQSGDIDYLKGRVNDVYSLKKQVTDLNGNVSTLSDQVKGMMLGQQSVITNGINSLESNKNTDTDV
jgi:SMC interacting uncharacterized protein involved in chromosome segregation